MTYLRYLLARLFASLLVLLSLSIIIFIISHIMPGDPVRLALGPWATQEQVEQLRKEMRLDKPLYAQYFYYLSDILHGNFGMSLHTRRPVSVDINEFFPATFELVFCASTLLWVIGIPLGLVAALHKDKWIDNLVRLISYAGVVTPDFLWAILLQLVFGYLLNILPIMGRLSWGVGVPPKVTGLLTLDSLIAGDLPAFLNAMSHLVLPAIALGLRGIGQISRITRAAVIDVSRTDYVLAQRSYGLPPWLLAFEYVLKPSFIPPLTILGLSFASMLGNAFLVETVFNWPGLARHGVQTMLTKDLNSIVGVVLVIGLFFIFVNFFIDILLAYIDPRIREKRAGGK